MPYDQTPLKLKIKFGQKTLNPTGRHLKKAITKARRGENTQGI